MAYGGNGLTRNDYDWSKLDEYAIYLHRQDAMRQKQGVIALQRKLKQDLDVQLSEQRRKKNQLQEEEKQYFKHQCEDIQAWKETEQMKADELKAKVTREKRDRDEQYQLEQSLKAAELDRKKTEKEAEAMREYNRLLDKHEEDRANELAARV